MKNILEKVFESVNDAGIEYVILRNYESLPCRMTNGDIDLLVSFQDTQRLKSILAGMNFLIVPDIYPHTFALFFDETQGRLIKFDIVDSLAFGKKIIIPFPACYEQRILVRKLIHKGFCIPSVEDEIILLLLHCIGNRKSFKPAYKERLQKLVSGMLDIGYLGKCLADVFGQTTSKNVVSWIMKGEFESLVRLNRRLKFFLLGRLSLESLLLSLKILNQRLVMKLLGRRGLSIALLGPDGSGKTTLAQKIRDRQIFNTIYCYMGRDQFLIPTRRILQYICGKREKNIGNNSTVSTSLQPKGLLPIKGPLRDIVDIVRFFHDLIDFYIRYFLHNYLYCRRGFLVVNDRYIYDMLVSGEKIQRVRFFRWIISSLFPSPDFVFLLDAPAKRMYARKGEHSVAILEAMKTRYTRLTTMQRRCYIIRTGRNADDSAHEIIGHIWRDYYRNLAGH